MNVKFKLQTCPAAGSWWEGPNNQDHCLDFLCKYNQMYAFCSLHLRTFSGETKLIKFQSNSLRLLYQALWLAAICNRCNWFYGFVKLCVKKLMWSTQKLLLNSSISRLFFFILFPWFVDFRLGRMNILPGMHLNMEMWQLFPFHPTMCGSQT